MKYYDRLEQLMGTTLEEAKTELIKFATPRLGGCEVLFDEHGLPVVGFNWTKTNRVGKWYDID